MTPANIFSIFAGMGQRIDIKRTYFNDWMERYLRTWVRENKKLRAVIQRGRLHNFISIGYEMGVVVDISNCTPEYIAKYFNTDNFEVNAKLLSEKLFTLMNEKNQKNQFSDAYNVQIIITSCWSLEYRRTYRIEKSGKG